MQLKSALLITWTIRRSGFIKNNCNFYSNTINNILRRKFSGSVPVFGLTSLNKESAPVDKSTDDFLSFLQSSSSGSIPKKSKFDETLETLGIKNSEPKSIEPLGEDDIPGEFLLPNQEANFAPLLEPEGLAFYLNPTIWFQKSLEHMHFDWGMPWGAAILIGGAAVRIACSSAHLKAERYFTNINQHSVEGHTFQRELRLAKTSGNKEAIRKASYALHDFTVKNKLPSIGQHVGNFVVQAIVLGSQVMAVDRLATSNVGNMLGSSFAWIPHMALPDPIGVLPMITACCTFIYLTHINLRSFNVVSGIDRLMVFGVYGLSFSGASFIYMYCNTLSAATNLSLAFNLAVTLAMTFAFRLKPVRNVFKLPQIHATFSSEVLKKSSPTKSSTSAGLGQKAQAADRRLKEAISDVQMLFTDPKKVKQKYDAMFRKSNDQQTVVTEELVDKNNKNAAKN